MHNNNTIINYSVNTFLTVIVLCVKIHSRKKQTMQIEVGDKV